MQADRRRSPRNKTITLTPEEEGMYLAQCLRQEDLLPSQTYQDAIVLGDCFSVMETLTGRFADLLIVDPPYNLDKTFGSSKFNKMDSAGYEAFTRRWIEAVLPALKETASIYICCDWKSSLIIGPVLRDYFLLRNRITWQREKGRGAINNWKNSLEDIWFATMSGQYTFHAEAVKQRRSVIAPYRIEGKPKDWQETESGRFRDTYSSNFWDDLSVPYWSMPENTDHPAQKPEKLMAKLILASTSEGDLILDPFAGVGSSLVTAKKLKRHYLGVEKEPAYCALAARRLALAENDVSIQGYTDGIFWERNTLAAQKKMMKSSARNPKKIN